MRKKKEQPFQVEFQGQNFELWQLSEIVSDPTQSNLYRKQAADLLLTHSSWIPYMLGILHHVPAMREQAWQKILSRNPSDHDLSLVYQYAPELAEPVTNYVFKREVLPDLRVLGQLFSSQASLALKEQAWERFVQNSDYHGSDIVLLMTIGMPQELHVKALELAQLRGMYCLCMVYMMEHLPQYDVWAWQRFMEFPEDERRPVLHDIIRVIPRHKVKAFNMLKQMGLDGSDSYHYKDLLAETVGVQ